MKLAFLLFITSITGLLFAQNRPDLSNLNPEIQWGEEERYTSGTSVEYFVGHDDNYVYFVLESESRLISSYMLAKADRKSLKVADQNLMSQSGSRFLRVVMMNDRLYAFYRKGSRIQSKSDLFMYELDMSTLEHSGDAVEIISHDAKVNVTSVPYDFTFSPDKKYLAITHINDGGRRNPFQIVTVVFDKTMNVITKAEYSTKYASSNFMNHQISIDNSGTVYITAQIDELGEGQRRRDEKSSYGFRTFAFEAGQRNPKEIPIATNDSHIGSFYTEFSDAGALYFVATFKEDHGDNARGIMLCKLESGGSRVNMINTYPFTEEFLISISIRGEFVRARGIDKLEIQDVSFLKDGSFVVSAEQAWTVTRQRTVGNSTYSVEQYLYDDAILVHFSADYQMKWCTSIAKKQRFTEVERRYGSYAYFNAGGKHLVLFTDALRNRDEYNKGSVRYSTSGPIGLFIAQIDDNGNMAKKPALGEYYNRSEAGVAPKEAYVVDLNEIYMYQLQRRSFSLTKLSIN